jgi:hypothetical protein
MAAFLQIFIAGFLGHFVQPAPVLMPLPLHADLSILRPDLKIFFKNNNKNYNSTRKPGKTSRQSATHRPKTAPVTSPRPAMVRHRPPT